MAKLIAQVYGDALFEFSIAEDKAGTFMEELQGMMEILNDNPDFGALMNHPNIAKQEKVQMVESVFAGRVSADLVAFLVLVVQKGRYNNVEEIFDTFLTKVKELNGIGVATVTTPQLLNETQKEKVKNRLLETTSFTEMEMHYAQDSSLIGGMVIRIGDRVVDSSVKSKLHELEDGLMKIQLQLQKEEISRWKAKER